MTAHDIVAAPRLDTRLVVADRLDMARLKRTCAQVVRDALARHLEDFGDLAVALKRLRDSSDPVLNWDDVRRELR